MATEKLLNALNDQFNFELLSGYYYMEMAAYCSAESMDGFAHFLIEQAKEEYEHAMKFYEFINEMDGRVKTQAMDEPKSDYNSFIEVFETALSHEKLVTSKIEGILDIANEENNYQTKQFLQWFIEEQREEENTMKDILFKLKGINGKFQGLYMLNRELSQR